MFHSNRNSSITLVVRLQRWTTRNFQDFFFNRLKEGYLYRNTSIQAIITHCSVSFIRALLRRPAFILLGLLERLQEGTTFIRNSGATHPTKRHIPEDPESPPLPPRRRSVNTFLLAAANTNNRKQWAKKYKRASNLVMPSSWWLVIRTGTRWWLLGFQGHGENTFGFR